VAVVLIYYCILCMIFTCMCSQLLKHFVCVRPTSIMLENLPKMLSGISQNFPIMPKNYPIMLEIMLVYFSYCIIYIIRLPGKFESWIKKQPLATLAKKFLLIVGLSNSFCWKIEGKLEGKIKMPICISQRAFMLKYYPLCQHYAQFLIVPIMLIIMPAYIMQA